MTFPFSSILLLISLVICNFVLSKVKICFFLLLLVHFPIFSLCNCQKIKLNNYLFFSLINNVMGHLFISLFKTEKHLLLSFQYHLRLVSSFVTLFSEFPSGKFGYKCQKICHCVDNFKCNKRDGRCLDGKCEPGYREDKCQTHQEYSKILFLPFCLMKNVKEN